MKEHLRTLLPTLLLLALPLGLSWMVHASASAVVARQPKTQAVALDPLPPAVADARPVELAATETELVESMLGIEAQ